MLGSIIGAGVNSLFNHFSQQAAAKKQYEYQLDLNNRQNKFEAEEAEKARQFQEKMYDKDYEQHTYGTMRKQMEDAGLSIGLMYGMGGSQGVGGSGVGSSAQGHASASPGVHVGAAQIDPLALSQIQLNKSMANVNEAQEEKIAAETKQLGETGEKTRAETKLIEETRNQLIQNGKLDRYKKFMDMAQQAYKNTSSGNENFEYQFEDMHMKIDGQSYTAKQIGNEIVETLADIGMKQAGMSKLIAETIKADKETEKIAQDILLDIERNKQRWMELGIMNANYKLDVEKFNLELTKADRDYEINLEKLAQNLGAMGDAMQRHLDNLTLEERRLEMQGQINLANTLLGFGKMMGVLAGAM